jgi:pimeloyl-ACP methyl ester carboxylesterase
MMDAALVGWSLGGHIVLEAAKLFPRSRGIVIWGTPPVGIPPAMDMAFLPNPAMAAAFASELTPEQIAAFGEACLAPGTQPDADFFEAFAQTDGLARATMGGSVATANYEDEVKIVQNLDKPLAILQGENEQLVNLDYLRSLKAPTLWRGAVQVIPHAGHSPQIETPAAFDALIDAFLEDTARK